MDIIPILVSATIAIKDGVLSEIGKDLYTQLKMLFIQQGVDISRDVLSENQLRSISNEDKEIESCLKNLEQVLKDEKITIHGAVITGNDQSGNQGTLNNAHQITSYHNQGHNSGIMGNTTVQGDLNIGGGLKKT